MKLTVDVVMRDADKAKSEARYTDNGTQQEHCGICQHFISPNQCAIVIGKVVPGGWCKFFERK